MPGNVPRFAHLTDREIEARLIELRTAATPILANNLLPHFTDHSVAHSDSLVELADQLIAPLQQSPDALSQEELQILYSACYLHDIGMQYENADKTQVISNLNLTQPWKDLSENTRRLILRQYHGAISAEMIAMSFRATHAPIGIQLKEDHYAKYVAPICEGHTLDTTALRYQEIIKDGPGIRTSLLSAVLRLADILDLSRRRANVDKAQTLSLELESQMHWWRHYFTEGVAIDPGDKTVTVWFDFPTTRFEEYKRIVPQLQMPWIRAEFNRHAATLNRYGLGWTVREHIEKNAYSTAEFMPEAVESEMLKQFHFDRAKEQESQQQALQQLFTESQPYIQRRLLNLKERETTLTVAEYLNELATIAADLAAIGGKRSAWSLLSDHYHAKSSSLQPNDRLEVGVKLAMLMMEDNYVHGAVTTLRPLVELSEHLNDNDPIRLQVSLVWARALVSVGAYSEAVAFIDRVVAVIPDEEIKDLLRAELAELQLLTGVVEGALKTSGNDSD
jgi:hypothetical protein